MMEFLAIAIILMMSFLGSSADTIAAKPILTYGYDIVKGYKFDDIDFATGLTTLHEYPSSQNLFDVTKFGAVGNGVNDDAKSFKSAWAAACKAQSISVNIIVPSKTFLVSSATFGGPCNSKKIVFQILGKIVAPPKGKWIGGGASNAWISFHDVDGLFVTGNGKGQIDGQGGTWWKKGSGENSSPTAMRFSMCNDLRVQGLTYVNSPRNHVSINSCKRADISDVHMIAPADSPNTDGIDISSSSNINIHNSFMETGDDCIAINDGTSNINISYVECGPGHGISIGSLGKGGKQAHVQGISVSHCTFRRSTNGVRIKTWQGGSGYAKNILFSDIKFDQVANPIIIDQFYCPHKKCNAQPSAVKISDVKYSDLRGTTTSEFAVNLNCSKTVPCTNIVLKNIDIQSSTRGRQERANCNNVRGSAIGLKNGLNCLTKGRPQ